MTKDFSKYFLSENPFPMNPTMNPNSSDIRINGTIFNSEIRGKELDDFEKTIRAGLGLIYVRAAFKERGMGKSALLVYQWNRLREKKDATAVYIKLSPTHTPRNIANMIVKEWHEQGYLWEALKGCLLKYVQNAPSPMFSLESIDEISRQFPKIPNQIDVRRYVYNEKKLLRSLSEWMSSRYKGILRQVIELFFKAYLSNPLDFFEEYVSLQRKIKTYDEIDFYQTVLEILKDANFTFHYLFLDQFEYAVTQKPKARLYDFCADMRRLLEVGSGCTSIGVTLHLDANQFLNLPECSHLHSIAPLDPRFVVDLELFNPERAHKLAMTYMQRFRIGSPPDPLFPFDEESIGYICNEMGGNPRRILRSLHFALSKGVEAGYPSLNRDFVKENLVEIAGRAVIEEE